MRPTREEIKKRLSARGRKGAEARWEQYHASIPAPNYHELPDPCFEISIKSHISGKVNTLVFHPGSRRGRYKIDVNGEPWQECGWSEAMAKIRKSCKLLPLYINQ